MKNILLALAFVIISASSVLAIEPTVPIDGNGNPVPVVWDGSAWVVDLSLSSDTPLQSIVLAGDDMFNSTFAFDTGAGAIGVLDLGDTQNWWVYVSVADTGCRYKPYYEGIGSETESVGSYNGISLLSGGMGLHKWTARYIYYSTIDGNAMDEPYCISVQGER